MTTRGTALLGTLVLCMCIGSLQASPKTDGRASLQAKGDRSARVPGVTERGMVERHVGDKGGCDCDVIVDTYPYNQDFETSEGAWHGPDDSSYEWIRNQGETPTGGTGPECGDHTTGTYDGWYMYAEASGVDEDEETILSGPCFDLTSLTQPQFSFWYHMFGDGVGALIVEISADGCQTWDEVFYESGWHNDEWFLHPVSLSEYAGQTIAIRFIAIRGYSYTGDIALDDIYVGEYVDYDGGCCNLDTGGCWGYMKESECNALGNVEWHLLRDCTDENFCPQPPPANDLCEDAVVVDSVPFVSEPVNYGWATEDIPVSCDQEDIENAQKGVWYKVTPDIDCGARVRHDAVDGSANTFIAAFTGPDCDNLTEVFCSSDQVSSEWQEVTFDVMAGTAYWILIGDYHQGEGEDNWIEVSVDLSLGACCMGESCVLTTPTQCEFTGGNYLGDHTICEADTCLYGACCTDQGCQFLTLGDCDEVGGEFIGHGIPCDYTLCPPINETCLTAISVTDGMPAAEGATTLASEIDDYEASCSVTSERDLWYVYTATMTSTVYVDTEGSYIWDTTLSVWNECGDEEIACEDYGPNGDQAALYFDAVAGEDYYIRFAANFGISGTFVLNISSEEAPQGACCFGDSCVIEYRLPCEAAGGYYGGDDSICPGLDCNANGVDDLCDLLSGASQDCTENGIPDECDIADGLVDDIDANGVPDECDPDCNDNGLIDGCDITCEGGCSVFPNCGQGDDCQGDGILDECQLYFDDCRGVRHDTGFSNLSDGVRPDYGWAYAGVADDFTLDNDEDGNCIRFDIFADPDNIAVGDLHEMRVRIFENFDGLMNLGNWYDATPVFDATYTVWDGNLEIIETDEHLYSFHLFRFMATGETWELNAGDYAIHLTFPNMWDVGFWSTAGSDDSECAVLWGDWYSEPVSTCPGGELLMRMSFALLGDENNDQNGNGVLDECDQCGDFTNPEGTGTDGLVDEADYWFLMAAFGSEDGSRPFDGVCDMVEDGRIDWLDYMAWVECYREANPETVWTPPAAPTEGDEFHQSEPSRRTRVEQPSISGVLKDKR